MADDRDGSVEDTDGQRPQYVVVGAPDGHDSRLADMPPRPMRVTNVELWEQIVAARVEGLNTRSEVVGLRNDFTGLRSDVVDLKQHVNDDVQALRIIIDGKLSDDQLLTSLGIRLLNNQWIRWVVGGIMAAAASTVVYREWSGMIFHGIHRFLIP